MDTVLFVVFCFFFVVCYHDPFSVLGKHDEQDRVAVRAFIPEATEVMVVEGGHSLQPIDGTGLCEWRGRRGSIPDRYRLIRRDSEHREHVAHDPYSFPPQLSDFDLHLFSEGKHWHAYSFLGAHPHEVDDIAGVLFAVWAPNAERVSVGGDFIRCDGRCHPMRVRGGSGVWELFIPDLAPGAIYKYEIRNRDSGAICLKAGPYGQQFELRPKTASIVAPQSRYQWYDERWMERRRYHDWYHAPMSIYELHLASWQRGLEGEPLNYRELAHRLARFVGSARYDHEDPRRGEHIDWGSLIYNYSRSEVRIFLLSSAMFWIEEFHIDGLRVDAVASMLYLDYSRTEWVPNPYGGRENLEAIDFLRQLNTVVHQAHPGVLMMAEESTSWPQVSRPVRAGGLGFAMKWNMGWMNDTLRYMAQDPVHRKFHHNMLTFSMLYCFTENFLLPFSHDEVVHGKQSMLHKMPGDEWQRHANLRLLYTYMYCHPGKKLLFMGTEFGQGQEWNSTQVLDWYVLEYPLHQGMKRTVQDLNRLYHGTRALHRHDFEWQGFEWIDCIDAEQSIVSFLRRDGEDLVVVIANFTPVPRHGYRIGVQRPGLYHEIFNSGAGIYGGSKLGNGDRQIFAEVLPWLGRSFSLGLSVPPLAAFILKPT